MNKKTETNKIMRGELYYTDLQGAYGSEQKGHRPVLVIQNNADELRETIIVASITSTYKRRLLPVQYPIRRESSILPKNSTILLEQIKTMDIKSLLHKASQIAPSEMDDIAGRIETSLGLRDMGKIDSEIKRNDIYLVNVGATNAGGKIVVPALILQNDVGNKYSPTTIVATIAPWHCPISSPFYHHLDAHLSGLPQDSTILLNRVNTIDKSRLIKRVSSLSGDTVLEINKKIRECVGRINCDI